MCVFSRKKHILTYTYINNETIKMVEDFNYLGIKFKYTGTLSIAIKSLKDQALRAFKSMLYIFDKLNFDIKTKLN